MGKNHRESGGDFVLYTCLKETDRAYRYAKLKELMEKNGLEAMFLCGDAAIKYVTGEYISGWGGFVLFPKEGSPILFFSNPGREYVLTPMHKNRKDYWIGDIRLMCPENVKKGLEEKKIEKGRLGVPLQAMPAGVYLMLKNLLPQIELVDLSTRLQEIRRCKKGGELELIREAVEIVDTCLDLLPAQMHEGMYEYEIKAILEGIMMARGAENTLILINSDKKDISSPAMPTDHAPKALTKGDHVVAEVTVCFRGYWVQKIAIYSFGEPDQDIICLHQAVDEAIWKGAALVKPGTNAKDVLNAIDEYIEGKGFLSPRKDYISGPQGHLSGLEMDEGTFYPNEDFILEEGMLFVLHPGAALPGWKEGEKGIFGPGTMFMVTEDGCRSLNRVPNRLVVIDC